jgi:uncharacterized protein (DUF362 family)
MRMASTFTRRGFMTHSAAAAGVLAATGTPLLAAPPTADEVKMAIARWKGAPKPTAEQIRQIAVSLTEKAIEGIGGMGRFVKKGSVVFLKPNMSWDRTPEQAANSNPDVIATVIKKCFEAGAKTVRVGDNTCQPQPKTYAKSGVAEAAKKAGAEVLVLDKTRFKETAIKGDVIKSIPIYPQCIECDVLINVPIVKHHRLAKMTGCMKNYMGIVENRKKFHQKIEASLVDITRYMKPQICIFDAVRILTQHGPMGGKLQDVATKLSVAAGVDIVALDAWGAEVLGMKPADLGSMVAAEKAGLGTSDYRSLKPKEIDVA